VSAVEPFESQRAHLLGLAYRMLGSHAEAEDIVQEAWLRWREVDARRVDHPRAFLSQTVTRLCLDRLKSAQANREVYVGPWLPEPIVERGQFVEPGPESVGEFAADLSYAFMLALERLSPLERAAFLLHDVFDADFAEVASALGRSEAACRQLASRARTRVRQGRPKHKTTPAHSERLVAAFLLAAQTGDAEGLKRMLAADARFVADGGGRIASVGIPIDGAERIAKVVLGLAAKHPPPADTRVMLMPVNGEPGVVMTTAQGEPLQTLSFEFDEQARITAIYVVRNPEKLRHVGVRH
jgi:RNA polymerase sigma-70 factor (ECF subfamily)